jgi:hypothetical protein
VDRRTSRVVMYAGLVLLVGLVAVAWAFSR